MRGKKLEVSCADCAMHKHSKLRYFCGHKLDEMAPTKVCTLYKKGQMLYYEGTRPQGIFCILSGKIKIFRTGSEGKDQIITIAKEGELLGYRSILSEELYPVSAMTLEDTKVCFIPKTTFLELLTANSDFAALLLKDACHELNHFTEDITNIAQKPVKERVAATLISLNELFKDGEEVTTINMTREDLANMVGTATETLIRLLQDFKKEGLITSKGRKITIEEPEKLLRIANL